MWDMYILLITVLVIHSSYGLDKSNQRKPVESSIVFPSENIENSYEPDQGEWWHPVMNKSSIHQRIPPSDNAISIKMSRLLTTYEGLRQLITNPDQMEQELIIMQRNSKISPNADEPMTLSNRMNQKRPASHNTNGGLARPAGCQPLLTPIPLAVAATDSTPDTRLWPKCTLVHRCSGCCNSQLMECQPQHTQHIHVMTVETRLTPGRNNTGLEYVGYKMVPLVEHTSCSCRCKRDAKSCTKHQRFDELDCACHCSNDNDRIECGRQLGRVWDWRICKCQCRRNVICSSGHFFDFDQCKCISIPETRFNNDIASSFFRRFSPKLYHKEKNVYDDDALLGGKEARHASPDEVGLRTVKVRGPQRSGRYNLRDRRQ